MLTKLKTLLGMEDDSQNAKLNLLLSMAGDRLCLLIGEDEVPNKLKNVVVEVACIRFNRIGSEGLGSHSVEGESMNFSYDDFEGYQEEINAWLRTREKGIGKVRFL